MGAHKACHGLPRASWLPEPMAIRESTGAGMALGP
jgi:hypothetical protein